MLREDFRFVEINPQKEHKGYKNRSVRIITDKATGVQYLFVHEGYGCSVTVLVDKDGKPLLNNDFINREM